MFLQPHFCTRVTPLLPILWTGLPARVLLEELFLVLKTRVRCPLSSFLRNGSGVAKNPDPVDASPAPCDFRVLCTSVPSSVNRDNNSSYLMLSLYDVDMFICGKQLSNMFSSVAQSCPTLCDPMNRSTPGLPVHHQLPEFTQTQVHRVSDAIQPSHPRLSPSPPAPNPSQHQSFPMSQLFAWGGQSTGVSGSASLPPKKSQGWSPLT